MLSQLSYIPIQTVIVTVPFRECQAREPSVPPDKRAPAIQNGVCCGIRAPGGFLQATASMHTHNIERWQHPRSFLGHAHDRNERRAIAVMILTGVMMVVEIGV